MDVMLVGITNDNELILIYAYIRLISQIRLGSKLWYTKNYEIEL